MYVCIMSCVTKPFAMFDILFNQKGLDFNCVKFGTCTCVVCFLCCVSALFCRPPENISNAAVEVVDIDSVG